MQQRFTFKKEERLISKKTIDLLFAEGKSVFVYPFRLLYLPVDNGNTFPVQVIFSVPKRSFKQAVKRNQIRRRMREAFRLNKNSFYQQLEQKDLQFVIIFIYVDKTIKDYPVIEKGMVKAMKKLVESAE